jgi:uncharacterized protein YggL (DUF469 family)
MKKRIRKKLRKSEFQEFGISVVIPADADNVEERLNSITGIADDNHILFVGGGLGRFVLPSEEYGDLDIPQKVETLILYLASSNESQPDCIIGYFIHPFEKEINSNISVNVKSKLEEVFGNDLKINCRIDLWN